MEDNREQYNRVGHKGMLGDLKKVVGSVCTNLRVLLENLIVLRLVKKFPSFIKR
jgi:hypothetical protein